MLRSVTVAVPARLHLGFLDIDGSLGRRFGSIGLSLSRPETRVTIARSAQPAVTGPESARAGRYLAAMRQALGLQAHHRLAIEAASPAHCGLGSGTQLALAVSSALRRLHGLEPDTRGDAERLGRGARSGVGIGLFEQGGLVLDGGRTEASGPAPIIARHPFPEEWRVLLLYDRGRGGIHGEEELKAFAELPPFPRETAAHLCHLVVMRALPGVAERDIAAFGSAIAEIQAAVGDWFAAAQGGRYASRDIARALEAVARAGGHGIGQSSWGPTGFAFAVSASEADRLKAAAEKEVAPDRIACEIVRGNNRGAAIMSREAVAIA